MKCPGCFFPDAWDFFLLLSASFKNRHFPKPYFIFRGGKKSANYFWDNIKDALFSFDYNGFLLYFNIYFLMKKRCNSVKNCLSGEMMRIIRFLDDKGELWTGCDYHDGSAAVILNDIFGSYQVIEKRVAVKKILAPFTPAAILCIGLNYGMHAEEIGMPLPEHPVLFMKNPAAVTGAYGDIEIPKSCLDPLQVDYEVELGVVMARDVKNISVEEAPDHIYGYTCTNDISARRWQKHAGGGQWIRGKSFDTFCPMGPELVTADEIDNPQNLDMSCSLNGRIMQQSSTSDMIFSVAEIISRLSQSTTLLSGTLILTGTPSGVGFTRTPPVYLKPGDLLESSVSGVGKMKNQVVAEQ